MNRLEEAKAGLVKALEEASTKRRTMVDEIRKAADLIGDTAGQRLHKIVFWADYEPELAMSLAFAKFITDDEASLTTLALNLDAREKDLNSRKAWLDSEDDRRTRDLQEERRENRELRDKLRAVEQELWALRDKMEADGE